MRAIDSNVVAEFQEAELKPFWCVKIAPSGTVQRYTTCDIPLLVNGERYEPRTINVSPARYSSGALIQTTSFEIDNTDRALTSDFIGGTPGGSTIEQLYTVLNASDSVIGYGVAFKGVIDTWTCDEQLSIEATGLFSNWTTKTIGLHPPSCRWKVFSGTECGYSGGYTDCDRTYGDCDARSNTDNFGGFRWLPDLEDKEVWWGRKPK